VFGAFAAEEMRQVLGSRFELPVKAGRLESGVDADVEEWIAELQGLIWRDAGLLRDAEGLQRAENQLEEMRETMPSGMTRRAVEARNLHTVAEVMVLAAFGREESRGAHYRLDFPQRNEVARHSVVERGRLTFTDQA
jgi:L-aspartate oxidase